LNRRFAAWGSGRAIGLDGEALAETSARMRRVFQHDREWQALDMARDGGFWCRQTADAFRLPGASFWPQSRRRAAPWIAARAERGATCSRRDGLVIAPQSTAPGQAARPPAGEASPTEAGQQPNPAHRPRRRFAWEICRAVLSRKRWRGEAAPDCSSFNTAHPGREDPAASAALPLRFSARAQIVRRLEFPPAIQPQHAP